MSISSYPTSTHKYAYFWAKYKPALLQLMIATTNTPQQYRFSSHEIQAANKAQKQHGFSLKIYKGKSINNIRESPIAKDLLWTLQQSNKAMQLSDTCTFMFRLDKQFVLHVTRESEADLEPKMNSSVD